MKNTLEIANKEKTLKLIEKENIEIYKKNIQKLSVSKKCELISILKIEKTHALIEILQAFKMSPSTYYYDKNNEKDSKDKDLIASIKSIAMKNKNYGRRRMRIALEKEGYYIGVYKIARLMKEENIKATN